MLFKLVGFHFYSISRKKNLQKRCFFIYVDKIDHVAITGESVNDDMQTLHAKNGQAVANFTPDKTN